MVAADWFSRNVAAAPQSSSGPFSSTLIPLIGPAVVQLPALSHTLWRPVEAFAVSVPTGTLVVRLKLASAGSARPEPPSDAVHAMLTSVACQVDGAVAQVTSGGVKSQLTVRAAPVKLKSHDSPVAVQAPSGSVSESWIALATWVSIAAWSVLDTAPIGTTANPRRVPSDDRSA